MPHETIRSLEDLPILTNRERDARFAILRRLDQLPIALKTGGVNVPHPEMVAMTLPEGSHFYRQPFSRLRETVWLLDSEEAKNKFLDLYVAEELGR